MTCEGDTRNYAWNSAGQMTSATRDSKITTFNYNDASWINGINGSNDVDTDYTYNSRGWMTDIEVEDTTTTPATSLLDLDYVYDANGNITSEDVGDETWTYTYDALNRLTAVDKPGTDDDIAYTYDVRGNRTDIDVGGTDNTDLTFNIADRLTRVDYEDNSYRIYTHDAGGNCTKEEFYSGQYLASPVVIPTLSSHSSSGEQTLSSPSSTTPRHSALSSPTSQGGTKGGLDWNSLTREEQQKLKEELLANNEEQQAKRKHYPFTHAPKELAKTKYLSPYLPETTTEDFYINSMLDWTNPELADYKRLERWRPDRNTATSTTGTSNPLSPNATFPADEETDYEYDQANRLITATLPDGVEIEFEYDGIGRRLKKTITDDTGTGSEDIIETTIKYHYIGGQLTTIEIDEETTDDSDPPVDTTTKDETIHIHLGPNSQPISFEWVRYDYTTFSSPPSQGGTQGGFDNLPGGNKPSSDAGSSTTATILDDTYWFHYDIHGNVLKVTDDTQTTKITYIYNTLGKLTTETNPDGIPNFFKFRGATQTLHDPLLDLYFGGGFYRPDLGTSLATVGVASNPTSGATVSAKAHAFKPAVQSGLHASLADVKGKLAMDSAPSSGANKSTPKQPKTSSSPTTAPDC